MELFDQFRGVLGIAVLLCAAWAISEGRGGRPSWRWIGGALIVQGILALLIVRVPFIWDIVTLANEGVAGALVAPHVDDLGLDSQLLET